MYLPMCFARISRGSLRPHVRRWAVVATCALFVCLGLFGLAGPGGSVGGQAETVLNLRVEKTISPVKVRVIQRAVNRANETGAELLIIGLDTRAACTAAPARLSKFSSALPCR